MATSTQSGNNRYIRIQQDAESIRFEQFQGEEHMVLPAVVLVEGVLHAANAPNPELSLASEFGKFPDAWNGRPVTLDHPMRGGNFVSASSNPKVFEEEQIGTVFSAKLDEDRLKVEFWVNTSKITDTEKERFQSGNTIEVSTGFFTEVIPVEEAKFNGRRFNGVQTSITPDHIAILRDGQIGACSVEDGCGVPRLNGDGTVVVSNKLDSEGKLVVDTTGDCGCGCGGAGKCGDRANAKEWREEQLIQLAEDGEILTLGEDVKSTDLEDVEKSYIVGHDGADKRVGESFSTREAAEEFAKAYADANDSWTAVYVSEGVRSTGETVYRKVTSYMPESRQYSSGKSKPNALAQFLLDKKDKILQTLSEKTKGGNGEDSKSHGGASKQTERNMAEKNDELISKIVANERAPFKDAEVLALMDKDELEQIAKDYEVLTKLEAKAGGAEFTGDISANGGGGDQPDKEEKDISNLSVEDFVANGKAMEHLPADVQAHLTRSLAKEKAQKTVIVKALTDAKYPMTVEELMEKDLDALETLAKWVNETTGTEIDYSGQGGPSVNHGAKGGLPEKGMFEAMIGKNKQSAA